jgi:glycerol-3-phosphate dehydrogenase
MARDAVDAVAHSLDGKVPPSCTDAVPLVGAAGYPALWNSRSRLAAASGLHVARIEHLLRRFGSLAQEVLELIAQRPDLGRPLAGADDYLRAEVVYACTHEGAWQLGDVLARRTHISIETPDRGTVAARETAELMAQPLRWTADQVEREIEHYRSRIDAERAAQEADTDDAALAIRLSAAATVPAVGRLY